jgi:Domain of unknown function (DUF5666)
MNYVRNNAVILLFASVLLCIFAISQDHAEHRGGGWMDQPHAAGTITAMRPGAIDLQDPDGKTVTVEITSETQFRKNRESAKISDFKVGDLVLAVGKQQKDGSLTARMIAARANGFMGGGRMMGNGFSREDLGKKFIMGQVQKIEETKLTILRPDHLQQVIEADESTSFTDSKGESITLPDVKIGDRVGGPGELKNGIFVPQKLRVFPPQPEAGGNNAHPAAVEQK